LILLNPAYPSKGQGSVLSHIASNVTADIVLETGIFKSWNSWNAALSHRLKIKFSVNTSHKLTILADATRLSCDQAR